MYRPGKFVLWPSCLALGLQAFMGNRVHRCPGKSVPYDGVWTRGCTMRNVLAYCFAGLCFLATIPMYKAIIDRGRRSVEPAADTSPGRLSVPVVEAREQSISPIIPDSGLPVDGRTEGHIRCARGFLYQQTGGRWLPMFSPEGRVSRCEIRAEPVRRGSSIAID